MKMMRYRDYHSRDDGWLKVFGALAFLFGMVMTVVAFSQHQKNKKYRDALIALSDQLPEEETAASRRAAWRSSQSPANRATVEERLESQRVDEE